MQGFILAHDFDHDFDQHPQRLHSHPVMSTLEVQTTFAQNQTPSFEIITAQHMASASWQPLSTSIITVFMNYSISEERGAGGDLVIGENPESVKLNFWRKSRAAAVSPPNYSRNKRSMAQSIFQSWLMRPVRPFPARSRLSSET